MRKTTREDPALESPAGRLFARIKNEVANTNKRLVRRWPSDGQLRVQLWLDGDETGTGRGILADVSNVSVVGFLVVVPAPPRVQVGTSVTLGEGDTTAVCEIVHTSLVPGEDLQQVGLHITSMTDEFCRELHHGLATLREAESQAAEPWVLGG